MVAGGQCVCVCVCVRGPGKSTLLMQCLSARGESSYVGAHNLSLGAEHDLADPERSATAAVTGGDPAYHAEANVRRDLPRPAATRTPTIFSGTGGVSKHRRRAVSENDECCIENAELCIKNEEFCI